MGLLIAMFVAKGLFHARTAPLAPPVATPSIEPGEQIDSDVTAALSSLESFSQARQSWGASRSEKRHFAELVTGSRVHWFGRLQSSWRPGTFNLISGNRSGLSIHMMAATDKAKRQVTEIPENSSVEVEGVLMDDQWMHLVDVRLAE